MDALFFSGIIIFIRVLFAVVCGLIAKGKGRNVAGWAVLGFLLALLPLILVLVLPNLKDQKEKEAYIAEENRRLREQLRQERIKSEAFRGHVASRLDAHDQHLGLDTRAMGPQLTTGSQASAGQLGAGGTGGAVENGDARWYYGRQGKTMGPVKASEITDLIRLNVITRGTLVWSEDLTEWTSAESVPLFAQDFA